MKKILKLKNLKLRTYIPIFIIFSTAIFIRTVNLSSVPYSFHEDEMSNTYIGRFILLNGTDPNGKFLPLFYSDKFGDYPPVLPMYINGISTFIFGVTKFAARFPTALFGALTIFPLYGICLLIWKKKLIGYICSILLVILPWHIVFSRSAAEGIFALFIFTLGTYFLLRWSNRAKPSLLIFSLLCFLLTYFIYPSFRIFVPLFLFIVPFILTNDNKQRLLLIGLACLTFLITVSIMITPWGKARYDQTSLIKSEFIKQLVQSKAESYSFDEGQNNILLARTFHNKPILYIREWVRQYVSYFNPETIILNGAHPYRYFPFSDQGFIYISILILVLIGVIVSKTYTKSKYYYLLLSILFLSVVPASLTVDFTPHYHRVMPMIIPIVIFSGYSVFFLFTRSLFLKSIGIILSTCLIIETILFWHQYTVHTASFQPTYRNDQFEEIIKYAINNSSKYSKIIMPGEEKLPLYYLFYTKNFSKNFSGKFHDNFYISNIDKIYFVNDWCPSRQIDKTEITGNMLLINQGDCEAPGYEEIDSLKRKNGTFAFRIYKLK
jgi:hypothetical protein